MSARVILEAAAELRRLAQDIKACNTNAAGGWDSAEDEAEYKHLLHLAERLERYEVVPL